MEDRALEGRTALVTGAGAGIGRGIAEALAAAGACVVGVGRREAPLREAIDALPQPQSGHRAVVADLAAEEDVARLVALVGGERPVDVVVNNAGTSVVAPCGTPEETWLTTLAVQFHAARRLAEAAVPHMRAQGWGRIVNVGGGWEPGPGPNASASAKAALVLWAKGLANEVASAGITVNTVNPGRINSEQILGRLHPDPEQRAAFIAEKIPAGRFGDPQDVAGLVAFLAGPGGAYITGASIPVDGGMRRWPL